MLALVLVLLFVALPLLAPFLGSDSRDLSRGRRMA